MPRPKIQRTSVAVALVALLYSSAVIVRSEGPSVASESISLQSARWTFGQLQDRLVFVSDGSDGVDVPDMLTIRPRPTACRCLVLLGASANTTLDLPVIQSDPAFPESVPSAHGITQMGCFISPTAMQQMLEAASAPVMLSLKCESGSMESKSLEASLSLIPFKLVNLRSAELVHSGDTSMPRLQLILETDLKPSQLPLSALLAEDGAKDKFWSLRCGQQQRTAGSSTGDMEEEGGPLDGPGARMWPDVPHSGFSIESMEVLERLPLGGASEGSSLEGAFVLTFGSFHPLPWLDPSTTPEGSLTFWGDIRCQLYAGGSPTPVAFEMPASDGSGTL